MIKHIPNILTVIRFIFIPSIVLALIYDNYLLALILFTLSSFTDVLDGKIARKYNAISDFGKLMDPLADKATQIATLIAIVLKNIIPVWILAIIAIKEVIMICGASFLYGKSLVVSSRWYGKLATVTIYVAIFFSMIIRQFDLPEIYTICNTYLYYFSIVVTLFSLLMYFKTFFKKDFIKDSM